MSLQAFLLRTGMRLRVKPALRRVHTVDQFRALFDQLITWVPPAPRSVRITPATVGGVPGEWVEAPGTEPDRVLYHTHGGAYCWGKPAYFRPLTWRLSAACRMAVFAVDYRLAPEHPFPAAVEDAAAAWRGLLREAGCDPRRIAIVGDSAGGGLMFATLMSLRDAGDPLPAATVALSPWTDLAGTGDSLAVNAAADPMFPPFEGAIERTAAVYLSGADPRTPLASPLYGDLHGLPPTLIQVGSTEILLDDSRRMAERLRAAGVPVELEVWPSMPHVWHMKADVVPEGRRAIERIGAFVRRHLDPPP